MMVGEVGRSKRNDTASPSTTEAAAKPTETRKTPRTRRQIARSPSQHHLARPKRCVSWLLGGGGIRYTDHTGNHGGTQKGTNTHRRLYDHDRTPQLDTPAGMAGKS